MPLLSQTGSGLYEDASKPMRVTIFYSWQSDRRTKPSGCDAVRHCNRNSWLRAFSSQRCRRVEPRGNQGAPGHCGESEASCAGGHLVRDWIALRGGPTPEGHRHRQSANDGSRPGGQGPISPAGHALTEAAGVAAHLLALAKANGLAVPRPQARVPIHQSATRQICQQLRKKAGITAESNSGLGDAGIQTLRPRSRHH
jgi:hypothetical protein